MSACGVLILSAFPATLAGSTPAVAARSPVPSSSPATVEPATVRVSARDVRVLYYGDVEIGVESADGAAHRVSIRVQTPAGLQAPDPAEVTVPAAGRVTTKVRVWRSSAPRGSRQALLVVAESMDGAAGPAVSLPVFADIPPDPAWMPRLRRPLGVLALLLMAAAAALEFRRRW